jgi:hypothetical protein
MRRDDLELPWFISLHSHKSAWMRFMPTRGDYLYVAFGPQNQARILSMAPRPNLTSEINQVVQKEDSFVPFGDWQPLQPGEFDMRSSGGAYMRGNRYGLLLLSGGAFESLTLDKQRSEARLDSGLLVVTSTGNSSLRLGTAKRPSLDPLAGETSAALLGLPDELVSEEFAIHVESLQGGTLVPSVRSYDLEAGTVRSSSEPTVGLPIRSSYLRPLRYRQRIWGSLALASDPLALPVHETTIDDIGNTKLTLGSGALALEVEGGPLTSMNVSANSASLSATTSVDISATTVSLATSTPDSISLGGSTALMHPVMGENFFAQLSVMLTALSAHLTTLSASLTPLVLVAGGPLTPPGQALTAAVTSAGLAIASVETLKAAILLPPPSNTMLSQKVVME